MKAQDKRGGVTCGAIKRVNRTGSKSLPVLSFELSEAHPPPMIVSAITLHDGAKAAGVHYSTVSLALRDNARIATATKENVQRIAARLGYTAHPAARALVERRRSKTVRGPVIAWIENHPPEVTQGSTAYRNSVLEGATRLAKTLGRPPSVYPARSTARSILRSRSN